MKLKHYFIVGVACLLAGCQTFRPITFTVATYNMRYANSSDSVSGNGWGQRYPVIAKMVEFHGFDIFGTQECLFHQLKDLKKALPHYDYIGVGRDDGKDRGEHSAIFYRTDKFELLQKGDFWLSETPEKPSRGWDASLPRICSWGHFKCKDTGFEFLFFNLHMDDRGEKARVESAYLVQKKMKEINKNLPAILTGDFNVDQYSKSYKALITQGNLYDSYEISDLRYITNGTFNGFNPNDFTEDRIDHIFVSPGFHVIKYGVLTDTYRSKGNAKERADVKYVPKEASVETYQARVPSDHFPVEVKLSFWKKADSKSFHIQ
ncbi:MAG: endonuclease/exonuclease/phosphatase family protein [Bacteroides sp.]|jgi:endonuclease/exonuclease/phosphatase family metal-dependent hydrolase|nr:endonuclease/exonuclease/phosphatase family protein [Bacteroides sp.]